MEVLCNIKYRFRMKVLLAASNFLDNLIMSCRFIFKFIFQGCKSRACSSMNAPFRHNGTQEHASGLFYVNSFVNLIELAIFPL